MISIDLTEKERAAGRLLDENLRTAVDALDTDGVVVLNDLVAPAHLDVLHDRLLADLQALQARPDAPYNWNAGNLQQNPPPFPPYLFSDVLLNPYVISVTSAVLGPGVKNVAYSGNTALPSDQRQPVHADVGHLWPTEILTTPHPAAQLVINVLTVDVSPANGATEIWLGTHRELGIGSGDDIKIPPHLLEARRALRPPVQPTFRRGSMLIRDIRLWHAGMPNRSSEPRPMIAMIHSTHWMSTDDPLVLPSATRSFFDHPVLTTAAQFTDGPIDHITMPQSFQYVPTRP
jgi:hypothetical protein